MDSAATHSQDKDSSSLELISHYLDDHGVAHKLFEHETRFSAAGEARASGVAPHDAAKSVLLRVPEGYLLAVIPASERLDLAKLRRVLEANGSRIRLATEDEMAADFPGLELGALPPLGSMLGTPEVIDARLLDHPRILCNAGDHRHSMLVETREIADLTKARVADICQD